MHAEGIPVAKVSAYAGNGEYFVTPLKGGKRRRVSGGNLTQACLSGPHDVFRCDGRGGGAGLAIAR